MGSAISEDPTWRRFVSAAGDYCRVVEAEGTDPGQSFLHVVLRKLLCLYSCAIELPDVEPTRTRSEGAITHEEWKETYAHLSRKLGERDVYWLVSEPYSPKEEEAVCTTLSDDLADIYRDLKNGFVDLEAGQPEVDVFWEWKFSFQTHWGRHAASAINALHSVLYGSYS